ncbi:MAG: hypothetical protein QF535_01020 [Anaerolineales bacterium]|jgi:hypothetical protein|nr:hypothetical protein [Anaerolineales bacterium]|tara:strand:+ start:17 stop:499 length:483 start_codon:yes stop_codon:yes gene_type:complete
MANPLYGQNKADGSLDNASRCWKVVKHKSATFTASSGIADGAAVITGGIPAYFQPVMCVVKNVGVALGSNAAVLEVESSAQTLTTSLASLAADAQIASICDFTDLGADAAWGGYTTAKNIIVETADLIGSSDDEGSESQLEIAIGGWDLSALVADLSDEG